MFDLFHTDANLDLDGIEEQGDVSGSEDVEEDLDIAKHSKNV